MTRPALLFVGGLAGAAYVWAVDPARPGHYPLCPLYAVTGLYCPGCGALRSTHDLLHGDLAGAFGRNPIWPLFVAVLVILFARWSWSRWTGARWVWSPPPWLAPAMFVAVIAFTVARNLPGWTVLSPV